jgi:hypothetical protein
MPLSYTIDRSQRVVIARASDTLSEDDIHRFREELQSALSFNPHYAQLVDLSDVTDIEVSVPSIARIAGSSGFAPGVRRAFVGSTDAQYGMARMLATFSEPHGQVVHVFRDRAVAEAWLSERRE